MARYHKVVKGNVEPRRALEILFNLGPRRGPREALTGELLTSMERDRLSDKVRGAITLDDVDIDDDDVMSFNGVRMERKFRGRHDTPAGNSREGGGHGNG